MRVLVAESGDSRAALAAVRGLAAAGWDVGVAVPGRSLSTTSRCSRRWHPVPPVRADPGPFVEAIGRVVARFGYEVILPCGDAEVLSLSLARDAIGAVVPLPEHEKLMVAMDKLRLTRSARRSSVQVPLTWEPDEAQAADVEGPVIVKPRLHWDPGAGVLRRPAALASDVRAARAAVTRIERSGGAAIVQERLRGCLVAWIGLIDAHGVILATVQQEALRTHPPQAGVTARGRVVEVSDEVSSSAARLLSDLSWTGLVQLQFIVGEDGTPRLVDFNARCYGSMALAIGAGVNFPALWASAATGRPVIPSAASLGARYQWLEGDLRSAWSPGDDGRARDVARALRWSIGAHHSIWRRDDPLPALEATRDIARRAVVRAAGLGRDR